MRACRDWVNPVTLANHLRPETLLGTFANQHRTSDFLYRATSFSCPLAIFVRNFLVDRNHRDDDTRHFAGHFVLLFAARRVLRDFSLLLDVCLASTDFARTRYIRGVI